MTISSLSGLSSSALVQRQYDQASIMATMASGKRINSAKDDPAGLVISQLMRTQIQSDQQASDNVSTAMSLLQTADGGLDQTQAILDQMRGLTLQASNSATSSPAQTAVLNQQFANLSQTLDRIASTTTFGGNHLLDGSFTNKAVQTGSGAGQSLAITISSRVTGSPKGFDSQGLGLTGANLSSPAAASDALARIDAASDAVGQQRGSLGALQSDALDSIRSSLATQSLNLADSESTISDTDFAKASTSLAKSQILAKSGMAMLVQGNVISGQMMMKLLNG